MNSHNTIARNIVLIEDNIGDIELLRAALEDAGVEHTLTVLQDGAEALRYIRREDGFHASPVPDLVVLDLNIPKHDGLEIVEVMRGSEIFWNVPVVVLTSSSSPRERAKLETLGITRHITKPPDLDEFLRIGGQLKEVLGEIGGSARSGH